MSRIGKKPIPVPAGVSVVIDGALVTVQGPKGTLKTTLNELVSATLEKTDAGSEVVLAVKDPEGTKDRAQWGTARAVIANLVKGVAEGFTRSLEINGVGFRVSVAGPKVVMNLGFSHDVEFKLPEGVTAAVDKNVLTIAGASREVVGQTAAEIRKLRKPEPYKGKGIRYTDEIVRRKAGKAAKAGE